MSSHCGDRITMADWPPSIEYERRLPERRERGIGIIGLGAVANWSHLPAYRDAEYRIVLGADIDERALRRSEKFLGHEALTLDYRRVLDHPDVEVVDIALPNAVAARQTIIHETIDAGKHVLVQKPFAYEIEVAEGYVRHAEEAGVLLAVNQNARWNPSYRAARSLVEQGELGELYLITHEMRINQDGEPEIDIAWRAALERPLFLEYSIHHFDTLRTWAGREPVRVSAAVVMRPGQRFRGEMIGVATIEFEGLLALILDDSASFSEDPYCRFRLEGTDGLVNGTVGTFGALGTGNGPGTIEFCRRGEPAFFRPQLKGNWDPDGFAATMGELFRALDEEREPEISGRDNLKSLRIAFAAERSARENRPVALSEIGGRS